MSPRPDVSAQRIPQILSAAAEVFGRLGLGAATVADIASAAGLSKALVFKYFRSKDELVLALVRSLFAGFPVPAREEGQDYAESLLAWAERAGAAARDGGPAFAAVGTELLALASRDPAMREVVRAAYADLHRALRGLVAEGMAAGEFAPGDADAIALAMIAQVEGVTTLCLADPQDKALAGAHRAGVALILRGIEA